MNRQKRWYDYLWVASLLYLILGFFNILFAWLGLLCFAIPLIMAAAGKDKGCLLYTSCVMGAMPHTPSRTACQLSGQVRPKGVTAPIPVMTTLRRSMLSPPLTWTCRRPPPGPGR